MVPLAANSDAEKATLDRPIGLLNCLVLVISLLLFPVRILNLMLCLILIHLHSLSLSLSLSISALLHSLHIIPFLPSFYRSTFLSLYLFLFICRACPFTHPPSTHLSNRLIYRSLRMFPSFYLSIYLSSVHIVLSFLSIHPSV